MVDTREAVPATVDGVVAVFGYRSCDEPADVFAMLRLVADVFSLEFPFDVQSIHGTDVVTDGGATSVEAMDVLSRLRTTDSFYETVATAKAVGCDVAVLERVVDGPFGWDFLDETRRYFWMSPSLPPHNFGVTGNAILTGLCKVFSVAREVTAVDLAQAISRHREVRRTVPRQVVEGIAARSRLFDSEEGGVRKKTGQMWSCLGQRDLNLLRVCAEHGRIVSSQTLQSSLVRYGFSSENAAATIAYSPLLVHTKAGRFRDEGIYKFVCSTEDAVRALREGKRDGHGGAGERSSHGEDPITLVRIAVSSRVRLSGSHFAPEPLAMEGEWRVRDVDGDIIGAVTLSGHLAEGLSSVVDALGLETDAVLELRRCGDGELLAVRA